MNSLVTYLKRIGLPPGLNYSQDRKTLAQVMAAQSRSIPFENYDVVLGHTISMKPENVETKLVNNKRGGYCFEQNTLLKMALEAMGFEVMPVLCRVRWGKPDDSLEPNTGFTHFALQVKTGEGTYLADVGFAGTNSMEPVNLDIGDTPQSLPEGQFRVAPSKHTGFRVLELLVNEEWRPLYEWRPEAAPFVDQEACNWFSCTYPKARFTSQFFCCLIVGEERHHILNNEYVIRKGHGAQSSVTKEQISDKIRLLELVDQVFGVQLPETEGIDRYLQ
jgi:N-hydroxyarylamine O-acetyltransferase